jgi:glycosyltransferase involved in cell wall biosynthesis
MDAFSSPPEKPVAAIFRSPLFNPSETFVEQHGPALRRYRPVFVGLRDKGRSGTAIFPRNARQKLALTLLGRCEGLAERVRAARPMLLHAHFGTDALLALPIAERLAIPLVTTLHGYEVSRSPARLLMSGRISWMRYAVMRRRLFERGRLFLAVSEALRQRALAAGYPEARTIVHYNGVDTGYFRSGGRAPEAGLILHVGRLVEKKGTAQLLDAFAVVASGNSAARLVVIGDGPLRGSLVRRASELGIADRVRFLGALGPEDVLAWMRRAWLLVAPSLTARDGDAEGLPMVICEAAAASLPVVATRHSGIPEAVIDGQTGFLVGETDVVGLAFRLVGLLGDSGLRERMGRASRDLAESRFDAARQASRLEDHYDVLTGLSTRTAPGFAECA